MKAIKKPLGPLALITLFIFFPLPLYGDIYQWVDEAGVIHFTNVPSEKKGERILKEEPNLRQVRGNTKPSRLKTPKDYSDIIYSAAEKYEIDPALIRAVIKAESNFRPDAISRKGARGLMQLMPHTAYELNVKNSFEPEENIEGGVRYLRYLLNLFNGNLPLALGAYNAGPELVQRLGRIPSIKETQEYVKKVLSIYNGTGIIRVGRETIYKIILEDGTQIFTNTPYNY